MSKHLSKFAVGDRLRLVLNPRFKKGRPNTLRFNNRFVEVIGLRGKSYEVRLKDGNKPKLLLVSNVHLEKVSSLEKV